MPGRTPFPATSVVTAPPSMGTFSTLPSVQYTLVASTAIARELFWPDASVTGVPAPELLPESPPELLPPELPVPPELPPDPEPLLDPALPPDDEDAESIVPPSLCGESSSAVRLPQAAIATSDAQAQRCSRFIASHLAVPTRRPRG